MIKRAEKHLMNGKAGLAKRRRERLGMENSLVSGGMQAIIFREEIRTGEDGPGAIGTPHLSGGVGYSEHVGSAASAGYA